MYYSDTDRLNSAQLMIMFCVVILVVIVFDEDQKKVKKYIDKYFIPAYI